MTPIAKVSVRDLHKRYDSTAAVTGVSMEIGEGEIFGLLGPNGAGKTTTVECIIGLRDADAGDIHVCGIDARQRPAAVKERIGAALQTTALQDKITPREALALFASFYRRGADPAQLLERFAIADKADAPFDSLSGGQRQRLALALAFVNHPEVVFLDEPTAGLDPHSRRELHGEILRMKRDGHTVFLTTHYLEEAEALCDRVAIIHHGRIAAAGSPRELTARAAAVPTVELSTATPIDRDLLIGLADGPLDVDVELNGTRARFSTARPTTAIAELMKRLDDRHIDIVELNVRRASLETLFLELTDAANPETPEPGPRTSSPEPR